MKNQNLNKHYNRDFYSGHINEMKSSATETLTILFEDFKPNSVIDVGCGCGAWLAAAEKLGAETIQGLDGNWITKDMLISDNINFIPVNFDEKIPEIKRKFDLCISLEVAEHISSEKERHFIEFLCKSSDVILFSAAIKDQGGTNHINEQWQSYWHELFDVNGYECLDIIRSRIWNNPKVEWWYKQNIFVYVNKINNPIKANTLYSELKIPLDIVHPELFQLKISQLQGEIYALNNKNQNPTFVFCLNLLFSYFTKKIKNLLHKQ